MVKPGDEIKVEFPLKVYEVVHKKNERQSIIWGHTKDGMYVCVPMWAVKEKNGE